MLISQSEETTVTTQYLGREGGRIAYDVQGDGPLVICAPGMGDIRQTFRYLVPTLTAAGYRVATFDLRGHGDSDTSFTSFDDRAEASTSWLWRIAWGPPPRSSATRWAPVPRSSPQRSDQTS